MSCSQLTISHFTVPCDLVWNSENTHCYVNRVHCSEKHDFVKWFRSAVKIFPVFTTIDFQCPKTGHPPTALKNNSETDWKVRVPSVHPHRGTLGTDGTRIFGSIPFLQKRSLQKLDAEKSSGIPPAADTDLVGVLDVIPALVLFKEWAEALLGKAAQSVIVTPQLINGVQVFGADLIICLALLQFWWVLQASASKSFAQIVLNPARSNPMSRPPAPQNKLTAVNSLILYLRNILFCESKNSDYILAQTDLFFKPSTEIFTIKFQITIVCLGGKRKTVWGNFLIPFFVIMTLVYMWDNLMCLQHLKPLYLTLYKRKNTLFRYLRLTLNTNQTFYHHRLRWPHSIVQMHILWLGFLRLK